MKLAETELEVTVISTLHGYRLESGSGVGAGVGGRV